MPGGNQPRPEWARLQFDSFGLSASQMAVNPIDLTLNVQEHLGGVDYPECPHEAVRLFQDAYLAVVNDLQSCVGQSIAQAAGMLIDADFSGQPKLRKVLLGRVIDAGSCDVLEISPARG